MSDFLDASQRMVELSHGRTRYFDAGEGTPTILLHGVGFSAGGTSWYRNIEALSAGVRVLAVDFVGWGLGDRLEQGYSFAYLVDFVREFQDALGIAKSNIVGHSMGGWIASLFAYESPERVSRLALTASGGVATRTLSQMTEFQPPSKEQTFTRISSLDGLSLEDAADWTEYDWANMQAPSALESYRKILANMNVAETRSRYNTLRRLPLIGAETLVAWGVNDDVNAYALGEQTAKLIPRSKLVTFDCGHMVPQERATELNEALLEFFA